MKIVSTDNYGRDFLDEKFVENLPNLSQVVAQEVCDVLNRSNPAGPRYFKVVNNDYKLLPGFEP